MLYKKDLSLRFMLISLVTLFITLLPVAHAADSPTLKFVSTPIPTLVSNSTDEARLQSIIARAFSHSDIEAEFTIARRAFVGSGLISGKYDGHFAMAGFDEQSDKFLYSAPIIQLNLFLVSKDTKATTISSFADLEDARVGILNRHAFNPLIRSYSGVKWSRNPTLADLFKQLGDKRTDFGLLDKLTIDELNLLLSAQHQELLTLSPVPLVRSSYVLSINRTTPNAAQLLEQFNKAITEMRASGEIDRILDTVDGHSNRPSLLNPSQYQRTLNRW